MTVKVTFEFETTQEFLDFFSSINQENTVKIELPAKVEPQELYPLLPEVELSREERFKVEQVESKKLAKMTADAYYTDRYEAGMTAEEVAAERCVTTHTVKVWASRHGLKWPETKKTKKTKKSKKSKKSKKAKKSKKTKDSEKEEQNAVKEWKKKYVSESAPLATPLDEEWQKLFDQGYSVKIAAELLNKGKGSAYHWARKFGKKWPRVSKVDKLHELQSKIAREIVSPPKEVKPTLTPPVKPEKATKAHRRNKQFSLVYQWLAKGISGGRVSTENILAEMRVPDQDIELATEICVELMEAACSMHPNDWACVKHPSDSGVTITTLLSFNLQAKLPSLEELRQH